jgi:hypothetical protein
MTTSQVGSQDQNSSNLNGFGKVGTGIAVFNKRG